MILYAQTPRPPKEPPPEPVHKPIGEPPEDPLVPPNERPPSPEPPYEIPPSHHQYSRRTLWHEPVVNAYTGSPLTALWRPLREARAVNARAQRSDTA